MDSMIQVDGLYKSYHGVNAVENLSISIHSGEVFGLLGANGAGKTTSIECILGVRKPDQGAISVMGMNPSSDRKKLFEKVGVQFQESSFQEQIKVVELCEETQALYKNPGDYQALLKQFGLAEMKKAAVAELSGGQKQRLFVVLALLPNPEVVFLDELTTGLDSRARRTVWNGLSDLKQKGMTILMTSHYMDEVETLCDRICILKKGKKVFMGTVQEAVKASPFQRFEDAYLWLTDEEGSENESI
jgi:ABC-2 type transport system ATP-binding protein